MLHFVLRFRKGLWLVTKLMNDFGLDGMIHRGKKRSLRMGCGEGVGV